MCTAGTEVGTGAASSSAICGEVNLTFFNGLLFVLSNCFPFFVRFRLLVELVGVNLKEGCARLSTFCGEGEAVIFVSLS